jgi:PQQ-like domain
MPISRFARSTFLTLISFAISSVAQVNVTTYHNDNGRTGQNTAETTLTTSNVNSTNFGKLFSQATDGYSYSQPLYVSNLTINGATHDVVYVATMNDSVYAFDANSNTGSNASPLWHVNFTDPSAGITTVPTSDLHCSDSITNQVGIFSTPVIDLTNNVIYVVARTVDNGAYYFHLHALSLTTGAEQFGGPIAISATVAGTGTGSSKGEITFSSLLENTRSALLLVNGLVYVGFASLCDYGNYHGWVFAYNASTLAQSGVWLTTPNGERGGVWQAGNGPAADSSNNVYVATGNGTFDVNTGGRDYGQSVVKVGPPASGAFPILDYFSPYNGSTYNETDLDIASSGLTLASPTSGPYSSLIFQGDKAGNLYVINPDNMGHYNSTNNNQIVQYLVSPTKGMWSSPAWWNNYVYLGGQADNIQAYSYNTSTGLLSTSPTTKTSATYGYPGTTVSISSNGTSNGIVWALNNSAYKKTSGEASLNAYKATDLATRLYSSTTNATRDNPGAPVKFAVPTIANGKVYIMTQKALVVYGLLK